MRYPAEERREGVPGEEGARYDEAERMLDQYGLAYICQAPEILYGQLPSYRAMLDKEGAAGPADVALVGNEKTLDAQIQRLRDVGVTDFSASIVPTEEGAVERTLGYLANQL